MANKYHIMGQLTSTHGEPDRLNDAAKSFHQCVDVLSKFCRAQNRDRYMRLDCVEVGISSY